MCAQVQAMVSQALSEHSHNMGPVRLLSGELNAYC